MSKIKNMASPEQRKELSKDILELKNELGLTYSDLTLKLSSPCRSSTLQIRATHPNKNCSLKLFQKIQSAIKNLDAIRSEQQQFDEIKNEFIEEVTLLTNKYFNKIKYLTNE